MPDFSKPLGGFGVGASVSNATFYLAVLEEYGNGNVRSFGSLGFVTKLICTHCQPSVGRRISLVMNQIIYNSTEVGEEGLLNNGNEDLEVSLLYL